MNLIDKWLKIIHGTFYPSVCLICGSPGAKDYDLCPGCAAQLPYNRHCCRICAEGLPENSGAELCGKCALKKPDYDRSLSMFVYQEPVRYLLRSLKFHSNLACARLLGLLMVEHLYSLQMTLPELIIPVPLHPKRFKQRGFNQSVELARPLSKAFGIPLSLDLCVRNRNTPPQAGLSSAQRTKNLKGAFRITRPFESKHVVIFDDIVTTGSTVNEIAKKLRNHGAECIEVWSIAKANLNP